jgi:two-component system chemotaxis sensor kinase CheA
MPCRIDVRIEGDSREAYLRSFLVKARVERMGRILGTDPSPEALRDSNSPFAYIMTVETNEAPDAILDAISFDQVSVSLVMPEDETPDTNDSAMAASAAAVKDAHELSLQSAKPDEVVRVSVQKLDTLLNLVGELVIYNSGFVVITQQLREQYGKTRFIYDLEEKTEALSAITRELQDGIMKARMLPIANVFNRFRRVVRDLAKRSGKTVILDVLGEETEIDKKVIDKIGEPLVHLVRNAVDHGLEDAAQRVAAGKSAEGKIRLSAYQEGDHICIEVADDGRGLDKEAILRKALEKGLLTREEAASASAERILSFIFLPGFSTAKTVSDISGRGVGMDAVRRAVDDMSGNLRVRSSPGAGTTVTITLPLTMAIVTAVLVEVAGSTYAIPLSAVREIVKTNDSILRTVGTRRVMLLRNEVLALVNLGSALQDEKAERSTELKEGYPIVVVDFEGKKIGLEVERIHGTREVVIKSLSRHFREVEGLIGASILGNGKIALIVDVETLISLHHHHDGHAAAAGKAAGIFEVAAQVSAPTVPDAFVSAEAPAPEEVPVAAPPEDEQTEQSMAELARIVAGEKGKLLEEVHNAGAIQASISLSQFTGQEIRVSFPESRMVPIRDVAELLGGEETTVGGIYVGVSGALIGGILLVIPESNLLKIDDMLHGRPVGTARQVTDIDVSAMSELGNILACCFINAIADSENIAANAEVPEMSIDMCLPVIDSVLARFNQPGDSLLLTEASIYGGGMDDVVCHQLLFMEPDSLRRLMEALAGKGEVPHLPVQGAEAL